MVAVQKMLRRMLRRRRLRRAAKQSRQSHIRWAGIAPLQKSIKTLVRPAVARTRRKELAVEHRLPRETFEAWMAPLTPTDAAGLVASSATR